MAWHLYTRGWEKKSTATLLFLKDVIKINEFYIERIRIIEKLFIIE